MRLFLYLLLTIVITGTLQAQQTPSLSDFYPIPRTVKKDMIKAYTNHLFSGCAEGNCIDGKGTWISVYVSGFGGTGYSAEYLQNVNLIYYITNGVFKDSGLVCEGQQTTTYFPLKRNHSSEDYQSENTGRRIDTSTADLKIGVFDKYEKTFYSNGEVQLTGKAKMYNYKKAVAWTQWDKIRYATVEYSATDIFSKFTGIVDEYLRPVYGVATFQNGSVFNGFFIRNNTGPGFYFKSAETEEGKPRDGAGDFDFMPDINLFQQAFSTFNSGTTHSIEVGWGDAEQEKEAGMQPVEIYRDLTRYGGGDAGWIFGEDGNRKTPRYTGKGIYYYSENLFYFGSFDNGRPDGKGFLYYRHVYSDTTLWPSETYFKYGNFIQGFFNDGYFIFKKGDQFVKKELPVQKISESSFRSLAKEANNNNTQALLELGDIYFEGKEVKPDVTKAIGFYKRALSYGNAQAAIKLGSLYQKGDPVKKIQRDSLKAVYYYKRGAQVKQSAISSAAEIKECLVKYFLFAYPYLTSEQAARFTLDDEYNMVSELSDLVSADWKKRRERERLEEEARKKKSEEQANKEKAESKEVVLSEEEERNLIGKIFFKNYSTSTGRNNWSTETIFYKITGIQKGEARVIYSTTADVTIRNGNRPVQLFVAKSNGFAEAKKDYHKCNGCSGGGTIAKTSTSTFKHTNDYTYTLGKKITYTSTSTVTSYVKCNKCYGAGFCPVDGSAPEW